MDNDKNINRKIESHSNRVLAMTLQNNRYNTKYDTSKYVSNRILETQNRQEITSLGRLREKDKHE